MTVDGPVFEIGKFKNGWQYREAMRLGRVPAKVDIYSCENRDQSYARISVWSPALLSWQDVWSLMPDKMATVTQKDTQPKFEDFAKDVDDLYVTAKKILGGD